MLECIYKHKNAIVRFLLMAINRTQLAKFFIVKCLSHTTVRLMKRNAKASDIFQQAKIPMLCMAKLSRDSDFLDSYFCWH